MQLEVNNSESHVMLAEAQIEKQQREEAQAICNQKFINNCVGHGCPPGANRPTPVKSYSTTAFQLRCGFWAAAVLATGVFALLNLLSLESASWKTIVGGSVVFAVLIGYVISSTVGRIVKVDVQKPQTAKRADLALIVGGITAVLSLSVFCFLRFAGEDARAFLPWIAMLFELGCMVFAAAAREVLQLYSWPTDLSNAFDRLQSQIEILDRRINACKLLKENFGHDKPEEDDNVRQPFSRLDGQPPGGTRKPNGTAASDPGIRQSQNT